MHRVVVCYYTLAINRRLHDSHLAPYRTFQVRQNTITPYLRGTLGHSVRELFDWPGSACHGGHRLYFSRSSDCVEHGVGSEDSASSSHADVARTFSSNTCPGRLDRLLVERCDDAEMQRCKDAKMQDVTVLMLLPNARARLFLIGTSAIPRPAIAESKAE